MNPITQEVAEMVAKRVYRTTFSQISDFGEQEWRELSADAKVAFFRTAELLHKFYEKGKEHGLLSLLDSTLGT